MSDLRPAQCHFIEILRAQIQNARLIVLEDITGTYSDVEKSHLSPINNASDDARHDDSETTYDHWIL